MVERLLPAYCEVLGLLAEWVQFDEPIFALDLTESERTALLSTYQLVRAHVPQLRILVASYFGELRENFETFTRLPVDALHLDAARAATELDPLLEALSADTILSLGVVDGRNVWRNDFAKSLGLRLKDSSVGGSHPCSGEHGSSQSSFATNGRLWYRHRGENVGCWLSSRTNKTIRPLSEPCFA